MNFLYVKAIESYHLPLRETRTKLHIKPLQKLEKKQKIDKRDKIRQCLSMQTLCCQQTDMPL